MRETLSLHPGLIVLRYKKGSGRQNAIIKPSVAHDSIGKIEIISDPLRSDIVLDRPGDTIVLRCMRDAKLHIDITSREPGTQARGSVTVEYLTAKKKRTDFEDDKDFRSYEQTPKLNYLGHVSYWGDISASSGAWIGGPERPMPLEGLEIKSSPADDFSITITDIRSGIRARSGEFLGTRGQSLPLRGLEFELGDDDGAYELVIEALFRDAGSVEVRGRSVKVTGAGYNDVLLGIAIELAPLVTKRPERRMATGPISAGATSLPRRERTKIFRR